MSNDNINFELSHMNDSDMNWPSVKVDAVISVILSYLSIIIGGFGIYAIFQAWQSFLIIGIACILWGISCVGLRRLSSLSRGNLKRNA